MDLFDLDDTTRPVLAPLLPRLRFLLDGLSAATPAQLAARTLTALGRLAFGCMQRMRQGHDARTELRRLRGAFDAARRAPDTGEALSAALSHIARVMDVPHAELRRIIRVELGPEMEAAMTSTYDQLLNEGRERGREEGRFEASVAILRQMLTKRFGALSDAVGARIARADAARLERWTLRVLDAEGIEQVFADE